MTTSITNVGVLGLGLIGGSIALGAAGQGFSVTGWDPDPTAQRAARTAGLTVALDPVAAVTHADLVILCGPLKTLGQTATIISGHVQPHAIVTDVGSVKGPVRESLNLAGIVSQYVGAHPMAGIETSGFAAATPDLLREATWAVTLTDSSELPRVLGLMEFLVAVFAARVITLSDSVHDGAAALISHVPHVLAHGLLGLAATSGQVPVAHRLAAGSFRDGTRVAKLNPERNRAMVEENRKEVAGALAPLIVDLDRLRKDLEAGADTGWFFERSTQWPRDTRPASSQVELAPENWRDQLLQLGAGGAVITGITRTPNGVIMDLIADQV